MSYLIGGIVLLVIAIALFVVAVKIQLDESGGIDGLAVFFGVFGLAALIAAGFLFYYSFGTESGQRAWKSWEADKGGGLVRTVDVYDYDGKLIQHYEGKLDVETNEAGTKVLFDLDGKRTIVYGAIVVVQEK